MDRFADRVAVITGAASGLGLAFAERAASLGMQLILADVEAAPLERAAAQLVETGAIVRAFQTDVSNAEQMAQLADRAFSEFGAVHLLFNNAGVAPVGLIWEQSAADWQWVLGVNVMGVANGLRSFVPRMLEQNDDSHIVNTASVAGFISPTTMGLYSASKHAVVTISETLHHDLRAVGSSIGVTVLCPAFVPTGIAQSERNRPAARAGDQVQTDATLRARASMERAVSSGRLSATDIAAMTFEAVAERRFYLFTHPAILPSVKSRHAAIAAGLDPDDPFARKSGLAPVAAGDTPAVRLETGSWSDLRAVCQPIRFQVFVDEQGIDPALELDAVDEDCLHCVAWSEGVAVGTGRLLPDGHIGRMAVLAAFRRAGVGGQILERMVQEARARGHPQVELSAQAYVEPFYRQHGFTREGPVYLDAGIEHVRMWRKL